MPLCAEEFKFICARNNWKITPQRMAVFTAIKRNKEHPSVECVWHEAAKAVPSISIDTVYRILNSFYEACVIRKLEVSGVIRYDSVMQKHHHFLCIICGAIINFYTSDIPIEYVSKAEDIGEIEDIELRINGRCRKCLREK